MSCGSKFARPYRTRLMRALNGAGCLLRRVGVAGRPLRAEALVAAACRRSGCDVASEEIAAEVASTAWREPFERLVDSYQHDSRLTTVGRWLTRQSLIGQVVHRLRAVCDARRFPAAFERPIPRPLIITGLLRSGMRWLHQLLSLDPAARVLRGWEAAWPSPPPDPKPPRPDPRIRRAERLLGGLYHLAPRLRTVRPLSPEGPEACSWLLFPTFVSPTFLRDAALDGYREWFWTQGADRFRNAYQWYRRQLQLLQVHEELPGHWVLRSADHLAALDTLLETFPDASVVWLHRDPRRLIPSACSLFSVSRGLSTDQVDAGALGREVLEMFARWLQRGLEHREAHPSARILDVMFDELIAQPVETVRHIYETLGYAYTPEFDARLCRYVEQQARQVHWRHRYGLWHFGLGEDEILGRFGRYMQRFGIRWEPPRREGHPPPGTVTPAVASV